MQKKILEDSFKKVKTGDLSSIEEILFTQSYALNVMFASMVARSNRQEYIANSQALMSLALKAQNQSRATLQTLIQLKQPSQTSFIKQQTNVAGGHQQINNGISFPENLTNKPNELLETQDGKWLDTGAQGQNALANSSLEALGKVHRGKDSRRKGKI